MKSMLSLFVMLLSFSASAEMGFYKSTDLKLPAPIRKAADSVFQVVAPLSDTYTVYQRADYNTPALATIIADLKTQKMELQWGQIDFCIANDLPVCIVYDDIAISTAFVVFDSHHLATNRHADENLLINLRHELLKIGYSEARVFEALKKYPIPMKVAKNFSTIPGLGTKHLAYARLFDGAPPVFFTAPNGIDYMNSDLIIVNVEAEVGVPLPLATAALNPGERLYLVGYPGKTTNRVSDYGVADSNGVLEISVSTGLVLSLDEGLRRLEALGSSVRDLRQQLAADDSTDVDSLKAKWQRMIFNDADTEHGASGSPYLNAAGEVVGIHSIGLLQYRGTLPSLSVSLGVAWPLAAVPAQDFQLLNF